MMSRSVHSCLLRAALSQGQAQPIAAACNDFPWTEFIGASTLAQVMSRTSYFIDPIGAENAVLKLIEVAVAGERKDIFALDGAGVDEADFVEPVASFIANGFHRALSAFIDHGFDPAAKYGRNRLSAIDVALATRKESTHAFFFAAVAKKAALQAIEDIFDRVDVADEGAQGVSMSKPAVTAWTSSAVERGPISLTKLSLINRSSRSCV